MTHVPAPEFFEACKKKHAGQPLTTKDREAIAIERKRTNALFERGHEKLLPSGPKPNDTKMEMLAAFEAGASYGDLAARYNITREHVSKTISRARKVLNGKA